MNKYLSKFYQKVKNLQKNKITEVSIASYYEVEAAEEIFYINYLKQGMTVFDVGANIGELSLLFSRFVGVKGAVHAFEASSTTFQKLKTLIELAMRYQVVLNHKAVADKKETLILNVYEEEYSGWNSLANRPLENYGINVKPVKKEEIEAITIDEYCQEQKISQIDLLKIDVEGAEFQVLLGAKGMLKAKKILCIVFEFGTTTFDMGNDPDEIEEYLDHLGYKIENIVKGNPIFPGRSDIYKAKFSVHIAKPRF
jgi:FkbM family methyltransferase